MFVFASNVRNLTEVIAEVNTEVSLFSNYFAIDIADSSMVEYAVTVKEGMHMRDSQKQKCYNAEDVIRKNQPHLIRRLETVGEMQDYVCSIHHSKILRRKYGALLDLDARPIHVGDGRARSRAGASGSSRIKMPTWSRCDHYRSS